MTRSDSLQQATRPQNDTTQTINERLNGLAPSLSLPSVDHPEWDQEILNYGAQILASGTLLQKRDLLELGWQPAFTLRIKELGLEESWFDIELQLIRELKYTPGTLFYRRAEELGQKILFKHRIGRDWQQVPWSAVRHQVDLLAASLISLSADNQLRVAIISENRLEVAYTDIACLSYGFVNVPIQPAAPPAQIEYILHHAEINFVFVSDAQHLKTIESIQNKLTHIEHIITFNDVVSSNPRVMSFRKLLVSADLDQTIGWLEGVRLSVDLNDIASIMYTSGTTGYPKGIVFTYENIISKRFARSLALNIGSEDRFLCFLPLFHTFGRFLELWGSIFWGAEYCFSSGKGAQSLLSDLQELQPSVLISIPKRWQDIYESIAAQIDVLNAERDEVHPVLEAVSGGKLYWGLSAAGYLPPEIFRFFQEHGIMLHSGYGMTEATGGITMTPTGAYVENSVGSPLPGMKIKLAEDSELWVKGPYVSASYWNPQEEDIRPEGWFTTGDIFQSLPNGQLEIIDRKKEIYKNAKGQTVAPQKIENMFRDFEGIHQLFIVGDHMPYNTALVRLNHKHEEIKLLLKDEQKLRDFVATMINSVNSFLAPFERIVNFRIIDRDFDKDRGELTEKGTFKRSVILKNFRDSVESLYETSYKSFHIDKFEIQIPNWVFLQRGWTRDDLEVDGHILRHRNRQFKLYIEKRKDEIQIGSLNYLFTENILKFDDLIRQPAYCIGNRDLEEFLNYYNLRIKSIETPPEWLPGTWQTLAMTEEEVALANKEINHAWENGDNSQEVLLPVIRLIYAEALDRNHLGFKLLNRVYSNAKEPTRHLLRYAFLRLIRSDILDQSQFAVQQVVALYPANELERLVDYALGRKELFPSEKRDLDWSNINIHKVNLATDFLKFLAYEHVERNVPSVMILNVLGILSSWAHQFPRFFARIRTAIISALVNLPDKHFLRSELKTIHSDMQFAFSRSMVKTHQDHVNSSAENREIWENLLVFEETVNEDHRHRIFKAFAQTTFLQESLYLFFDGAFIQLKDIPPQGIWVNFLGSAHGKTVYRATVQGKERSYKFAIDLNDQLTRDQLETELYWLLACGRAQRVNQLVETVGSYQPEYDLWSEEFIPGLTVRQYLEKSVWAGASDDLPAPEFIWPHFVWTGVFTYTAFWKRTRFQKMIKIPSPGKIIIPIHDYYSGGRLVSIADIQPSVSSLDFMETLERIFIRQTESRFPDFKMRVSSDILYLAMHEALGEKHSARFFREVLEDDSISEERQTDLGRFLEHAEIQGYIPKSVYFATRRFHRWFQLNQEATLNAKAHILKDLYHDYHIQSSESSYPDARVQLFSMTVFEQASPVVSEYFQKLGRNLRHKSLDRRSLQSDISQFISLNELSEFDEFFLKRLAFPDLPPSEDIELIATRSTVLDDVEVMISRHDQKGSTYRLRKAMHPKEIIQLHQLFRRANMEVNFTQEHQYLVALNQRDRVIGGLFFLDMSEDMVYLDKVVVAEGFRGTGISRGILEEFFNRKRNLGKKMVTTGFLHPGFFYKFGFRIEKDQGGLVKYL